MAYSCTAVPPGSCHTALLGPIHLYQDPYNIVPVHFSLHLRAARVARYIYLIQLLILHTSTMAMYMQLGPTSRATPIQLRRSKSADTTAGASAAAPPRSHSVSRASATAGWWLPRSADADEDAGAGADGQGGGGLAEAQRACGRGACCLRPCPSAVRRFFCARAARRASVPSSVRSSRRQSF